MFSVVLMAALTTGVDLPDRGGCRGGCYGGCHGGRRHGCCGCYGGYGSGCMGMGCYGGYGSGCMGMGCYGGYGSGCMGMGCYGGYGSGCMGMGCMGGYGGGMMMMQGATSHPSGEKAPKPKEKREEGMVPAPATILVQLPVDAKLLIDNEATTSTGASRAFQSPTLNPGKEYQYTLTASIVRDGKPIKAEQVITVKAGQTTPVTLTLPTLGVAQR
jgi:uncharacterized protein (TIGR03000 family)